MLRFTFKRLSAGIRKSLSVNTEYSYVNMIHPTSGFHFLLAIQKCFLVVLCCYDNTGGGGGGGGSRKFNCLPL